ncbi:DUF3881 family protein [Mobilitalea sibirica]|uniref:DUF3881 family protein n=1 Tax=Mobilitalea sibirica TaxID=1462919 RepID=A0A8J7HA70_9FIRM|nr:DUF3881 family protein [Mobilitalea sibirica]MBH1941956.1 DUF3881 family protein [Mobilitalea sibirica]
MHSYLRAIGFSNIKNRIELDQLFDKMKDHNTKKRTIQPNSLEGLAEISAEFADGMGITLRGEYDTKQVFHMEHYFPYVTGQIISTREEISINKRVDTEAYTGMCDDYRLGVSLIFYLQNVIEYLEKKNQNMPMNTPFAINLAALSLEGRVLLPIEKDEIQVRNISAETKYRNNLIAEAKKGNQDAIDSLTIDDIDTYALVSRRAKKEDIYSIVDTCFIPFGSESDNYSIMATILESNLVVNSITKEEIYDLQLVCNDITFRLCINKQDLLGEPLVGRRFKGNIWMQGNIAFSDLAKD